MHVITTIVLEGEGIGPQWYNTRGLLPETGSALGSHGGQLSPAC